MPTFVPAKKNTQFIFYVSLISQANTKIAQANPTLAAGDVKVATDDGAPANLGTLPVVDADFTKRVKVTLSTTEMNGDNATVIFNDAAGAEWCDLTINIQTVARQIDDLAFPNITARGIDVDATGGVEITPNQAVNATQWAGAATATDDVALATAPTNFAALSITAAGLVDITQAAADKVWASTTRTLTSFGTLVADVTNAVWDELVAEVRVAASYGQKLKDLVLTAAGRVDVGQWLGVAPNALIAGRVDANAQVVGDKTGYSLTQAFPTNFASLVIDASGIVDADVRQWLGVAVNALIAGRVDANAQVVGDKTEYTLTAAERDNIIKAVSGTADSGSTTTIVDAERTEADTDYWKDSIVVMTSGPAVGQARRISAFAPATDTITVDTAFTQAIAVGNTYLILRTAMQQAAGAGSTDWTAAERNQIRDSLGVDGTKTAATGGQVQGIKAKTDSLTFTIANKVDASIQAAGDFAQAAADKVWASATRTLTAFSTALAVSVWDVLESAILTASGIGLKVKNNLDAAITTRATPAQVNAEVVDALNVDTYAEPGQEAPPATTTLVKKVGYLYKAFRNRFTQDATTFKLHGDDGTTVDQKATVSDDGTTFDRGGIGTGP